MYYDELKMIIEKVVKYNIKKDILMEYIINTFDCKKIYDSDDQLVTDAYFTLKHYAIGEESIDKKEWLYFLDCLTGRCEYNIEEKRKITTMPYI